MLIDAARGATAAHVTLVGWTTSRCSPGRWPSGGGGARGATAPGRGAGSAPGRGWRAWLAEHHGRGAGVWLVTWRAGSGGPRIGYEESVEQALCFGWVDSKGRALDAERTMLWFAPRKRGSGWARTNKERIERLAAA